MYGHELQQGSYYSFFSLHTFLNLGLSLQGQKLVYGCGKAVVIRSIADPLQAELYTEHQKDVTVARFSPSGNYIASADCKPPHLLAFLFSGQ